MVDVRGLATERAFGSFATVVGISALATISEPVTVLVALPMPPCAAHQRPQVFQVVVDRDVRDRGFGRVRLRFITNRDVGALPTLRRNTPTGTMAVSTPALTGLDLANRPEHGGALHNVAAVLVDLANDAKLDDAALAELVPRFPLAASRRLAWIVERFIEVRLDALAGAVVAAGDRPSKLD